VHIICIKFRIYTPHMPHTKDLLLYQTKQQTNITLE